MAIAQQMHPAAGRRARRRRGGAARPAAAGRAAARRRGAGIPELMNPADVAKVLGVTEADVIASIEAGDLKGKKIGTPIASRGRALDEFLKH